MFQVKWLNILIRYATKIIDEKFCVEKIRSTDNNQNFKNLPIK